jgi:DNA-binding NtrC family response regulator
VVREGSDSAVPLEVRPLERVVREHQRAHVLETLVRYGGDRTRTAKALGISPSTLKRKLRVCSNPVENPSSKTEAAWRHNSVGVPRRDHDVRKESS